MKLKIENLSSGYDEDVVLRDLSLAVAEGEFLSLLGPSGCGKSTLMKTIAGILPARKGRIYLDGQEITNLPVHKRGTVVVFQDMRLFPHKSVAENVAFPLKMQGIPKQERLKTAEMLLEKVRMAGFGSRKPGELSGGQQQRIALARALAAQPKLLLLDEPFSTLDENLREDMRHLVLQLQKEFHMTVILVTHGREEALSMSDRVALLFDGQLNQIGTPGMSTNVRKPSRLRITLETASTSQVLSKMAFSRPRAFPAQPPFPTVLTTSCPALTAWNSAQRVIILSGWKKLSSGGTDSLICLRSQDDTLWKKACRGPVVVQAGDIVYAQLTVTNPVLFP